VPEALSKTRVAAIMDPGPIEQQIATALNTQPDFQLVELITSLEKVTQTVRAAQAGIILVGDSLAGQPTTDLLDDLALQFPEAAVVAILPDGEAGRTQQAILAGARAFIVRPFTQVNLVSTLRRVRDLEARRRRGLPEEAGHDAPGGLAPLRVLSVFGPRGGAGASTLAVNLAIALAEETSKRVLLLEGKLLFGHLDLFLNLRTRNTIAELLPHAHHLDEGLVREVVAEHVSGIHVLLAPSTPEVAQGVRPEPLFGVVDGLRAFFDYIVIDAGSALDDNTVTLLDLSDRVLLVTNPELAALHDATRFILISRGLDYAPGKVLTVLNRTGMEGGLRAADVLEALRHDVFAQVPDGGPAALRSLNRGLPLLHRYPRSPASRGIQRLARSLLGHEQPQAAPAAAGSASGAWGSARPKKALGPAGAPRA
jgi:pilus assembly protein CpaE